MSSSAENSLMDLVDINIQLVSLISGYRAQLIGAGFADEVADEMAADYHRSLITKNMADRR